MWIVLFVHGNYAVDVVGFARTEPAARAMAADCAQEQVRQASGAERARERYTKPKLDGFYLHDEPEGVTEVRRQTAGIATDGWFGSAVAIRDELVGRYLVSSVEDLHPKTPEGVHRAMDGASAAADARPARPAGRRVCRQQPPQPWMNELRQRISGKEL